MRQGFHDEQEAATLLTVYVQAACKHQCMVIAVGRLSVAIVTCDASFEHLELTTI